MSTKEAAQLLSRVASALPAGRDFMVGPIALTTLMGAISYVWLTIVGHPLWRGLLAVVTLKNDDPGLSRVSSGNMDALSSTRRGSHPTASSTCEPCEAW